MALFPAVVVDQPVANAARGVGQKGTPQTLIAQDGLIEGEHGDAQRIVMRLVQRAFDKFGRLAADEVHVLADQGIGRVRIGLGGLDLKDDLMLCLYHGESPR